MSDRLEYLLGIFVVLPLAVGANILLIYVTALLVKYAPIIPGVIAFGFAVCAMWGMLTRLSGGVDENERWRRSRGLK